MRYSTMIFAAALLGCGGDGTGPAATKPVNVPPLRVGLWGMVIEENGHCIAGASVSVVSGESAGQTLVQQTPCDVWDPAGFTFTDLTPGVAVTIRASAPGYATKDTTVVPTLTVIRYEQGTAILIEPSKE